LNVKNQSGGVSPQSRGRELVKLGPELWQEAASVRAAAAELMSRYPEIPSLQAFRYACGLSQNQAADRYNATTEHRTTLGNTTINSWESWARRVGGSPPPFSSLLVLAQAYGRGPLGVAEEDLSPADLVADCYERLLPEDQISLRRYSAAGTTSTRLETQTPSALNDGPGPETVLRLTPNGNVIGPDFALKVPTVQYGNP
jgi:hypothetical protein